jgi:glycosyltransferase involved in cell wall biosynthesis
MKLEGHMKASSSSRVLMLLENNPYPLDMRVLHEATALVAAGYQVYVISPSVPGQPWCELLDGVQVYRFPAPPAASGLLSYLLEYAYSMLAALVLSVVVYIRNGFDIIHAHNPPDTFAFLAALYKPLGKRFIFDHHDLSPEMYQALFGGKGKQLVYETLVLLEKVSCRLADHVIATNQSYKTVEMERCRVPEERITIVRNGPDVSRLQLVDPDNDLRQKANTIIAWAGLMGFHDGVEHLLRALWHLIHDLGRTDWFCIIIGKGNARPKLSELAAELGIEERVWFTGWLSGADYVRYLATADICVDSDPANPYTDRSTMMKLMDYMAVGKPIVAFDLTEHRFTAQAAALYVRPNDELEFARGLVELMDDPQRRQTMGAFGRQRVETELAWCHSVTHLMGAYRAVLAN